MPAVEPKPVLDPQELRDAVDFALDFFNRAHQNQALRRETYDALIDYYRDQRDRIDKSRATDELRLRPREQCWSCKTRIPLHQTFCPDCGAPAQGNQVDRLRQLVFLCFEIKKHEREGRIPLSATHAFLTECNERIASLRRKLDQERAPLAEPVSSAEAAEPVVLARTDSKKPDRPSPGERRGAASPGASAPGVPVLQPARPKRNLLEILLDPRSIQWLLASGGALLVLGLIIYLGVEGLFQNKLFVACLLGAGTGVLLAGGWALILGTRYHLAGRALTLLACLVMPLNLWFYDAQGLIPIEKGGHLWIPALVCCLLYAISARLLKDVMFVPVLVLGAAATGLLILADQRFRMFWEIAAPSVWLVALGVICIHLERAFPDSDSPFGRKRFGLAFFWSGQAVMAAGLLLLLGAQLCGGVFYDLFRPLFEAAGKEPSDIVTKDWGQMLALGLVLAAGYTVPLFRPGGAPAGHLSAPGRLHLALGRGAADSADRMEHPDGRGGSFRPGGDGPAGQPAAGRRPR